MQVLTLYSFLFGLLFLCPALAQDTTSTEENSSITTTTSSSSTASPTRASLADTAAEHGAGRFGEQLVNNLAGNAPRARTAFAVRDDSFRTRFKRQADDNAQFLYQVSDQLVTAADLRGFTGSIIGTLGSEPGLDGRGQVVLSQGQRASSGACNGTAAIELFSGLGNSITILEEDIEFDGGILHIVSGQFTQPSTLLESLRATSETTTFASYLASNDRLSTVNSVTVFAPSNAALASAYGTAATLSGPELTALIDAHVVPSFAAYSPLLVNGARFRTLDGVDILVSTLPDGSIVLNDDINVIKTDIVTQNGVVHIIDRSDTGSDTVFTGGASNKPELDRRMLGPLAAVVGGARLWF
ncbi:FAS1 domain-containing protein [Aspergillus pseudoustus]|uniref:FAS1 domain-containing protein n=1 Tax=Aspergillus pseudoustus TaxID=1810923 RepID=A0ABR4K1H7_9EURO